MTAQLPPLLWHALDRTEEALSALQARVGSQANAKEILGVDPEAMRLGWDSVRQFKRAREAFQKGFAALDADREPSRAHFELARLIDARRVEVVVSYNWDTCLERAYERTFGVTVPSGVLYKPHGDVARLDGTWILPDEAGIVTAEVRDRVAGLADRPRALLVVGYSGSDQGVVENLLEPLAERWPVFRVSPSASGEGAIKASADDAVGAIADAVAPANALHGWKYVTFHRSRGFSVALRGERLRPTDVDACPELAVVPRLVQRLRDTSFATLSGGSGTGKSISAFHVARRLNRDGWRIVELLSAGIASLDDVTEFENMQGPVLALVDDAQAITRDVLSRFESAFDDTHAVLLVSTKRLQAREDETILASEATAALDAYCRAELDAVGQLLTELDDRVRWAMGFETPKDRLRLASRAGAEPWLYMFIASGGDRRITSALDRVVEFADIALLLTAVCVTQMTSRDAGATRDEVQRFLTAHAPDHFLRDGEFSDDRMEAGLLTLSEERLVRYADGRLRAPHLRIAERALRDLGQREGGDLGRHVRRIVRDTLIDRELSVLGKFWLLRVFDRVEAFRYRWAAELVDADVFASLVEQCLGAEAGWDRGTALHLVWSADWLRVQSADTSRRLADAMIRWAPTLVQTEVQGYKWMLSGIRSRHPEEHQRIAESVPARVLGERLSVAGSRVSAMDWAEILRELAPPWDAEGRSEWEREFEDAVDLEMLAQWLHTRDEHSQPFETYDLIEVLAELCPNVAVAAFVAVAAHNRQTMEKDLAGASRNFSGWFFGAMLLVAMIADSPGAPASAVDDNDDEYEDEARGDSFATPQRRALAATVLREMLAVDWAAAARSLRTKRLYETSNLDILFAWLAQLSLDITDQLAEEISESWWLSLIDESREQDRTEPFAAIAYMLRYLSFGERGHRIVEQFLIEHADLVTPFPAALTQQYPRLAADAVLAGRGAEVRGPRAFGWHDLAQDLAAVARVNADAALSWMPDMVDSLREAIEHPQPHDLRNVQDFIEIADRVAPSVLNDAICRVEAEAARATWARLMGEAPQAMRVLLARVASVEAPISQVASHLLGAAEAPSSPPST